MPPVALHVGSRADRPATITVPGPLANDRVRHANGDLVHAASEDGDLIEQDGTGTPRLRTLGAGREDDACTAVGGRDAPFKGSFVQVPAAG